MGLKLVTLTGYKANMMDGGGGGRVLNTLQNENNS